MDPQSLNLYAFSGNNPSSATDAEYDGDSLGILRTGRKGVDHCRALAAFRYHHFSITLSLPRSCANSRLISRNSEVQFKHIHPGFTEKSELAWCDMFQNNLTDLVFRQISLS